jgi:hypothetical protein
LIKLGILSLNLRNKKPISKQISKQTKMAIRHQAPHKTSTLLYFCFAIVQFAVMYNPVDAFPGAAGHCETGDLSDKNAFQHGTIGGGAISNGQLQVSFDSTKLQTYTTAQLNANQKYAVTLDFATMSSSFFFRGLLFRLSGKNGEDLSGTFSVGDDDKVQLKGGCAADVSAMTHNSNIDKTSVTFDFEYTGGTAAEVLLEVTVMREKAANNWFYSSFNIQIGDTVSGTGPTPAPSAAPSAAPTPATPTTSSCVDPPFKFRMPNPNGKKKVWQNCNWVAKDTANRCKKVGVKKTCPVACGGTSCTDYYCTNSPYKARIEISAGKTRKKNCKWTAKRATARCKIDGVKDACRKTCLCENE